MPKDMTDSAQSRMRWWLAGIALALLAIVPYLQSWRHQFINLDDPMYVSQNYRVQAGITWESIRYAFTTFEGGNWHPVSWLSHMLDCTIFGLRPGWHHLVSVLVHAVNTLLLWRLLTRLTGAMWRSSLVAALFAAHPLHVESVAWVAERKDVLSTLFGLLAIGRYVSFVEQRRWRSYVWMLVWFALSLMCKPMFVTLPFVLLLLDIWPLRRWSPWKIEIERSPSEAPIAPPAVSVRSLILEKLPLIPIVLGFSVLAMISQSSAKAVSSLETVSLAQRLMNTMVAYAAYVQKLFVPVDLAVFYPRPASWPVERVWLSALLLAAITIVALVVRRRRPWVLTGWLLYLGMLVPVIGLVQIGMQAYADRYMYVPALGLFFMLVWSLPQPADRFTRRILVGLCVVVVLTMTAATYAQVRFWRDSQTLHTHAYHAMAEGNYLARQNLGNALELNGQYREAMEQYREAARIRPNYAPIHVNIANLLIQAGQFVEAMEELNIALQLAPDSPTAHNSIGVILMSNGRFAEAEPELRMAVEDDPDNLEAAGNLGVTLVQLKRWNEAIPLLRRVAEIHPKRLGIRTNLALALAGSGRRDEAIADLQDILGENSTFAPALEALSRIQTPATQP